MGLEMKPKRGPMQFPVHIPFIEQLGLELHSLGDGESDLRVDLTDAHMNAWSVAHGGVIMTLLDAAMAHAAQLWHVIDRHALAPCGGGNRRCFTLRRPSTRTSRLGTRRAFRACFGYAPCRSHARGLIT